MPSALVAGGSTGQNTQQHQRDDFFTPGGLFRPEELNRPASGQSVLDQDSVVGDFGRTYHAYNEGKYLLPNNGAEQDRLDFQHAAFTILLGDRLTLAPIPKNPQHVLDVATGTGIRAIEFADKSPLSHITGTDLSAIQPNNAPPNCHFLKDDAEEEWVFPHKFDYVHLRFVFSCFSDPKNVMRNAFGSMKPGGWIEFQDPFTNELISVTGLMTCVGTAYQRWGQAVVRGVAAAVGRDIAVAPYYAAWLREVGFVDVVERRMIWPANPWSEDPD
ncbi:S-adenosyl-L-methionine-dependent methyltransferase [Pseudomassariella vexata]|uniref:S-adenosyl-L-methionine-dependent methyltransferase n=1 Tax=Pseudomassariella vexata TaxID=1141098 RepID=A0A1Y2E1R2_9PEZI|nr:S-adenosyl-L-methionine-dependent methyltransferase [Pseudomassariella vexata]ORY65491.1 S-adenosyl-L-methionine-dependent methyltransferase [Pseudomassariella vexata]